MTLKRRAKVVKLLPYPSCCGLGLHSRQDCSRRWWALTPPFHPYPTLFKKENRAVCFLLHCPSPCGGRPLDGTLLHCSPDFPHGVIHASIRRTLCIILANFKKKRKSRLSAPEKTGAVFVDQSFFLGSMPCFFMASRAYFLPSSYALRFAS